MALQAANVTLPTSVRLTLQRNIRTDLTQPRWARFCHGSHPCAFCVRLAARGYEYTSRESADFGSGFHDGHCNCTVELDWGEDTHLLDKQRQWRDMYLAATEAAGADGMRSGVFRAMRRLYPDRLGDGVVSVPGIRWSHAVIRPTSDEFERLSEFTVVMSSVRCAQVQNE